MRISRWKNPPGRIARSNRPLVGSSRAGVAKGQRRGGRVVKMNYRIRYYRSLYRPRMRAHVISTTAAAAARDRIYRDFDAEGAGRRARAPRASRSRKTLQPPLIASSVATLSAIFFKLSPDTRHAAAAMKNAAFYRRKHRWLPPPSRSNRRACRTRSNAVRISRSFKFQEPSHGGRGRGGGRARARGKAIRRGETVARALPYSGADWRYFVAPTNAISPPPSAGPPRRLRSRSFHPARAHCPLLPPPGCQLHGGWGWGWGGQRVTSRLVSSRLVSSRRSVLSCNEENCSQAK